MVETAFGLWTMESVLESHRRRASSLERSIVQIGLETTFVTRPSRHANRYLLVGGRWRSARTCACSPCSSSDSRRRPSRARRVLRAVCPGTRGRENTASHYSSLCLYFHSRFAPRAQECIVEVDSQRLRNEILAPFRGPDKSTPLWVPIWPAFPVSPIRTIDPSDSSLSRNVKAFQKHSRSPPRTSPTLSVRLSRTPVYNPLSKLDGSFHVSLDPGRW